MKEKIKKLFTAGYWKSCWDFHVYPVTWLLFAMLLALYPACRFFPPEWGWENHLLENLQLLMIAVGMGFAFFEKERREMLLFLSMLLFVLFLREVNFGKTLFFPDPDNPNEFLRWSEIWYAPYVDPVMIAYGICVAVYFVVKKVYLQILDTLLGIRFPVWHIVIFLFCTAASVIVDKVFDHDVLEESLELISYTCIATGIGLYVFHYGPNMNKAVKASSGTGVS